MQLPSVLLPAIALLAQTASSFLLSSPHDTVTSEDFAKNQGLRIGFYRFNTGPTAAFVLDDDGNLNMKSHPHVAFFDRGGGLWRLEFGSPNTPGAPKSIKGPFATEGGLFKYKGEGGFEWYLCNDGSSGLDIVLGAPRLDVETNGCIAGVDLIVEDSV